VHRDDAGDTNPVGTLYNGGVSGGGGARLHSTGCVHRLRWAVDHRDDEITDGGALSEFLVIEGEYRWLKSSRGRPLS
jgi:hypothetical protein